MELNSDPPILDDRNRQLAPEVSIHDLVGGNTCYLDEFFSLYLQLLPQYDRYLPVMQQRAQQPAPRDPRFDEHQCLVRLANQPVGLVTFVYNRLRNLGIGLDLAVHPAWRGHSLGGYPRLAQLIIAEMLEQICRDAARQGNPTPLGAVVEVEHAALLERYAVYGLVPLPVEYYEPPVTPAARELLSAAEVEQAEFTPLALGFFPIQGGGFDWQAIEQRRRILLALLIDHYGLEESHWVVQTALRSAGIVPKQAANQ